MRTPEKARAHTMPTSDARRRANAENARRSTGPRTELGKMISRSNSYKNGMTGEGIVIPDEDRAEVDRLIADLEARFQPADFAEADAVRRMAIHSLRRERCARQEASMIGHRMRDAIADYDDKRRTEAEKQLDWLAAEPATHSRRLRRTPEGIALLIRSWRELAAVLTGHDFYRWDYGFWQRIENLKGRRPEDLPVSRDGALSKALWGDTDYLQPGELEGNNSKEVKEWARKQLLERVEAEIRALEIYRESFDPAELERDRREATTRAIFDDSKEGVLARKYEAASERAYYKALNELRQLQAERRAVEEAMAGANEAEFEGELGSFSPEPSEPEPAPPAALGSFFPEPIEAVETPQSDPETVEKRASKRPERGRPRPS
jgi:hypothetical protein